MWIDGRDVADVTEEPTLRRGIDTLARYFDAQRAPETKDLLTCIDPEMGERISTWLVPRSSPISGATTR
jgi:4-hydroxyphenylacetate 3-monooxygenase